MLRGVLMFDIDSNISLSKPLIQDFPSLVSKFRDALNNDNSQNNFTGTSSGSFNCALST